MNIYDIAEKCGVSIATVSRVLNNSPLVGEKTRQAVLSVIEKSNYTPNAYARGLGLNTMQMIGVLCTDVSDIYYAKAVSLVERNLRDNKFDSLLACSGYALSDKKDRVSHMIQKGVDAIILIGSVFREESDNSHIQQAAALVPVILINGLVDIDNVYCVLCDEREAMRKNVHYLAERNCRNILYIYDVKTYSESQKMEGLCSGLTECAIQGRQIQINTLGSFDGIQAQVEKQLREDPSFDAVLASSDYLAVGALKAMKACGRQLPLIGFDNSAYSMCASPEITSVDNGLETLCDLSTNILVDLLGGKTPPKKIVISAKLVERETFRLK